MALPRTDVRYWHIADVQTALMNVRLEGNNGHDADAARCPLMTQSGHCAHGQHRIDAECTRRAIEFMKRSVASGKPFYAYVPYTLVHFPTLPNPKFIGKTGFGDFPDALAEMDAHVGEILDAIDDLHIHDNTIVVFTSDNGPEATWPWQGASGPWRGYYFTHMEGSLRAPFIIRWPGRIPAGRVSNEIVHEVDTFTTFATIAGSKIPSDRPIDAVDQTDFLSGKSEKSNREGFPVFVADRLEAVKWRN